MIKHSITKIILYSAITVIFIGLLSGCSADISTSGFGYDYPESEKYSSGGASLPMEGINELEINWVGGNVDVHTYEGTNIEFSETASSVTDELKYYLDDDRLIIRFCDPGEIHVISKDLTVMIPQDLNLSEIVIDSVSADVTLKDISCVNLKADNTSGKLTVDGSFQKIKVDSISGDTDLTCAVCPLAMNLDTISGSLILRIPENEGFECNFEKVNGSMECSFEATIADGKITYKNRAAVFNIETISGNIKILKKDA